MREATSRIPLLAKARFLLIGLVVGLLGGAAGAGTVWLDGRGALADAEATIETTEQQAASEKQALQEQVDDATRRISLLQSRLALTLAGEELARGNFGTAGEHLGDAGRHLSGIEEAAALRARIADTTLVATGDSTGPRARITELATAVDALLAP